VFIGSSLASLDGAVAAGLGIRAMTHRRVEAAGFVILEDGPLPKLADLYGGVLVREGGARGAYEELADDIAAVVFPAEMADSLRSNTAA